MDHNHLQHEKYIMSITIQTDDIRRGGPSECTFSYSGITSEDSNCVLQETQFIFNPFRLSVVRYYANVFYSSWQEKIAGLHVSHNSMQQPTFQQ